MITNHDLLTKTPRANFQGWIRAVGFQARKVEECTVRVFKTGYQHRV